MINIAQNWRTRLRNTQSQFLVYFHVNCLETSNSTRILKMIGKQVLKEHLSVAPLVLH